LPARSIFWTDRPVALPPGRARLATKPLQIGSVASAKTIGMVAPASGQPSCQFRVMGQFDCGGWFRSRSRFSR
jgi:hypothetical protein